MLFDKCAQGCEDARFSTYPCWDENPLGGTLKVRFVSKPNEAMRTVHERLMAYLRRLPVSLPYAMGARPGNSPRKNAGYHRHNRFVYLTDIHRAYPSVDGWRLAATLIQVDRRLAGHKDSVHEFLERYCLTEGGGLITGAPASPDLFNLYLGLALDPSLGEFARAYGLAYSRYLDDLIFSSRRLPIGETKRRLIRTFIEAAGFQVNHRKSRVWDLRKGPIIINGIGIAQDGRTFLPRWYLRKLRGLVHAAMRNPEISPDKVAGTMGVFWAATDRSRLTQAERKLVEQYRAYQQLLRKRQ